MSNCSRSFAVQAATPKVAPKQDEWSRHQQYTRVR